jgi:hypothetical protein
VDHGGRPYPAHHHAGGDERGDEVNELLPVLLLLTGGKSFRIAGYTMDLIFLAPVETIGAILKIDGRWNTDCGATATRHAASQAR